MNLATFAEPLWELLKDGVCYKWLQKYDEAMHDIKAAFRKEGFAFFDINKSTEVAVDASPVGLGAVLNQFEPAQTKKHNMVTCASRRLTEVERRYSQVEKTPLAVVWACDKLRTYLFERDFRLVTDNRAVELIFNHPNRNPSSRIRRRVLRLLGYRFTVELKPGAQNIADYLSR